MTKNPPIWAAHTRTNNMLCTPYRALSRNLELLCRQDWAREGLGRAQSVTQPRDYSKRC